MSSGAEPTSSSRARWTSRAATVLLAEILGAPRLEEMRLLRVVFLRGGVGSGAESCIRSRASSKLAPLNLRAMKLWSSVEPTSVWSVWSIAASSLVSSAIRSSSKVLYNRSTT